MQSLNYSYTIQSSFLTMTLAMSTLPVSEIQAAAIFKRQISQRKLYCIRCQDQTFTSPKVKHSNKERQYMKESMGELEGGKRAVLKNTNTARG
mmetsp:Transcript_17665/g.58149  ORF Transcript_17665/g.58149 Transcript_17665/m.58149 type:complete len:93 (+) Transcript_17665:341-619(+)